MEEYNYILIDRFILSFRYSNCSNDIRRSEVSCLDNGFLLAENLYDLNVEIKFLSQRIINNLFSLFISILIILMLSVAGLVFVGFQLWDFSRFDNDHLSDFDNLNYHYHYKIFGNEYFVNVPLMMVSISSLLLFFISLFLFIFFIIFSRSKPFIFHLLASILVIIGYVCITIIICSPLHYSLSNKLKLNEYGFSLWISIVSSVALFGLKTRFFHVLLAASGCHTISLIIHAWNASNNLDSKLFIYSIFLDIISILLTSLILVASHKIEFMEREAFLFNYKYNLQLGKLEKELEIAAHDANTNEILLEIERGKSDIYATSVYNNQTSSLFQWSDIRPILQQRYQNIEIVQPRTILQSLLLSYSSLKIEQRIGSGSFGEVYRASLFDYENDQKINSNLFSTEITRKKVFSLRSNINDSNHDKYFINNQQKNSIVAVKRILTSRITRKRVSSMLQEIIIQSLCDHPNIVKVFGWIESPFPCIVLEYMENGSLDEWLKSSVSQFKIGWDAKKLRLAIDAASGLTYLHARGIIHRDIKAMNFLVNSQGTVKISDFGSARPFMKGNQASSLSQDIGTALYIAPEIISNESGSYDEKADVWSFGLVICEILTHSIPYTNPPYPFKSNSKDSPAMIINDENEFNVSFFNLIRVVENDLNPMLQLERYFDPSMDDHSLASFRNIPEPVIEIIRDCVSHDPKLRPQMRSVLFRLFEAATVHENSCNIICHSDHKGMSSHLSHSENDDTNRECANNDNSQLPKRIASDICSSRKKFHIKANELNPKTPSDSISGRTPHKPIKFNFSQNENFTTPIIHENQQNHFIKTSKKFDRYPSGIDLETGSL